MDKGGSQLKLNATGSFGFIDDGEVDLMDNFKSAVNESLIINYHPTLRRSMNGMND